MTGTSCLLYVALHRLCMYSIKQQYSHELQIARAARGMEIVHEETATAVNGVWANEAQKGKSKVVCWLAPCHERTLFDARGISIATER